MEAELRRGAQLPAAAQLPPQQLAHIDKRLKAVRGLAHRRWVKLKYLEHRVRGLGGDQEGLWDVGCLRRGAIPVAELV